MRPALAAPVPRICRPAASIRALLPAELWHLGEADRRRRARALVRPQQGERARRRQLQFGATRRAQFPRLHALLVGPERLAPLAAPLPDPPDLPPEVGALIGAEGRTGQGDLVALLRAHEVGLRQVGVAQRRMHLRGERSRALRFSRAETTQLRLGGAQAFDRRGVGGEVPRAQAGAQQIADCLWLFGAAIVVIGQLLDLLIGRCGGGRFQRAGDPPV